MTEAETGGIGREQVLIAVPMHNGWMHGETAMGIWNSSTRRRFELQPLHSQNSVLPWGFNRCWEAGIKSGYRWFAMCHADVVGSPFWLDRMIEALESRGGGGVISAAIPLKGSKQAFSTAMGQQGVMHCHHRLTEENLRHLPEVFTSQDVNERLLIAGELWVNTGLMVADMGIGDWHKKVWFEFVTRMEWKGDECRHTKLTEDWRFSQMLHGLGVPVYGMKIRVKHWGGSCWYVTYPDCRIMVGV